MTTPKRPWQGWGSSRSSTCWWQAATSRPRSRWDPVTTRLCCSPATARTVVSTDMLVAGRHFRLDWSSPHDVGRKAIAQNAADIEAMGALPTAFVVAFGAPGDTPTSQALELADGMWERRGGWEAAS